MGCESLDTNQSEPGEVLNNRNAAIVLAFPLEQTTVILKEYFDNEREPPVKTMFA